MRLNGSWIALGLALFFSTAGKAETLSLPQVAQILGPCSSGFQYANQNPNLVVGVAGVNAVTSQGISISEVSWVSGDARKHFSSANQFDGILGYGTIQFSPVPSVQNQIIAVASAYARELAQPGTPYATYGNGLPVCFIAQIVARSSRDVPSGPETLPWIVNSFTFAMPQGAWIWE